ncbi:hypothetical protein BURMUCGD1_6398 [Burkholderia multivorans CGD1]|nr:hypothetical protein BURMUCGD1_6398 [Burkholderia multivorans CGD1]
MPFRRVAPRSGGEGQVSGWRATSGGRGGVIPRAKICV